MFGVQKNLIANHHKSSPLQSSSNYYLFILGVFLFTSPFYVLPRGLPQPADYILVLAMLPGLSFIFLQANKKITIPLIFGGIFVAITISVNLTNFFFYEKTDPRFLKSSLYYLYNFSVFIFIGHLVRNFPLRAAEIICWSVLFTTIFQILSVIFFPDNTLRQTGLFANPNQLGYWSLLTFFMLILARGGSYFRLHDYFLILGLLFLETSTLSKAGMITFLIGMMTLPFLYQFNKEGRYVFMLGAFIAICAIALNPEVIDRIKNIQKIVTVYDEISTVGQEKGESFSSRGYSRIWSFPHFTILGSGEGGFDRYKDFDQAYEMHSGWGTIIFSYGIMGAASFIVFLGAIALRIPVQYAILLGCVILYGIPHQNIRFTHFWVFLAVIWESRAIINANMQKYKLQAKRSVI